MSAQESFVYFANFHCVQPKENICVHLLNEVFLLCFLVLFQCSAFNTLFVHKPHNGGKIIFEFWNCKLDEICEAFGLLIYFEHVHSFCFITLLFLFLSLLKVESFVFVIVYKIKCDFKSLGPILNCSSAESANL